MIKIDEELKEKKQPKALNTVELLKVGSDLFDLKPIETINISQKLYERGFISYPRTETTEYITNIKNLNKISSQLCSINEFEWNIKGQIDTKVIFI